MLFFLASLCVDIQSISAQTYTSDVVITPANVSFYETLGTDLLNMSYQIINESGKIIQQGWIKDATNMIDLRSVASGHYTLIVDQGQGRIVKQLNITK